MLRLLLIPLMASLPGLASADAPAERFALRAELTRVQASADGRYTLAAQARYTPAEVSADGRFAIKSANADCGALPDPLFANGFE